MDQDHLPAAGAHGSPTAEDVGARWETSGQHYATDRWRGARAKSRDSQLVARLLKRLPSGSPPITAWLDVPCGAGRMRQAIDAPWTGVDISPSMVVEAAQDTGPVLRGSAARLPFEADAFDAILCCRLIHHYPSAEDRQRVLDELLRVARHYVLLSYWDSRSLTAWRRQTTGPLRRRKGHGVRYPLPWSTLRTELETRGATILSRAFSMRFLSAQTFVLLRVD